MTGMLDSVSATGTCLYCMLLKPVEKGLMRKKFENATELENHAFPTAGIRRSPLVYRYHAVLYHA